MIVAQRRDFNNKFVLHASHANDYGQRATYKIECLHSTRFLLL